MVKKVGNINNKIIHLLSLSVPSNKPIFIGDTNIEHIKSKHLADYQKYGDRIPMILASPDYVGINKKDNSIEYIKEFKVDDEYVKVAVRVSNSNTYFVRSLYIVTHDRINNFIKKKTLLKY